jgi:predicted DNA-binding transcriptional regulator AlpA
VPANLALVHHLVGVHEIAQMLGVTRQRVQQLTQQGGFPAPEAVLKAGKVWKRSAVEAWAKKTGRL